MSAPVSVLRLARSLVARAPADTALAAPNLDEATLAACRSAGLLAIETAASALGPCAWLLPPEGALELHGRGVAGWRIGVRLETSREQTLDALARSEAAWLFAPSESIAEAAALCSLPGTCARASARAASPAEALALVAAGAGDLVVDGWGDEELAALREGLGDRILVERTALPPGLDLDPVREALDGPTFTAYLHQTDAAGRARPRTPWAPGRDLPAPVPPRRLSSAWCDPCWREGRARPRRAAGGLSPILERALGGAPPTTDEVERLFRAHGDQVDQVAEVADRLRARAVGDEVTYVVNRNINYTNVCYFRCGFCGFSRGPKSLNLRGEPYLLGTDEVVRRAVEAWGRGATEVTLQGGIHPDFTGEIYLGIVEAIKARLPGMHVHGFTPLEVWQGATTLGLSVRDFLARLRAAGLGSLPGTAAEVLDDRVRRHLCPDKVRTAQWAEVMISAHELGLRSNNTLMFGHIDSPRAWARHLEVVRQIQRRTGGFTEFVPLPFVHMGAPIYLQGKARPGPTWDEVVLVHAVARIALDGLVPNVQASWVKLGLAGGGRLLAAGCNDLGGTLMDENISRAAGASHGQLASPAELEATIRAAGRTPAQRTTLYGRVEARLAEVAPTG